MIEHLQLLDETCSKYGNGQEAQNTPDKQPIDMKGLVSQLSELVINQAPYLKFAEKQQKRDIVSETAKLANKYAPDNFNKLSAVADKILHPVKTSFENFYQEFTAPFKSQ